MYYRGLNYQYHFWGFLVITLVDYYPAVRMRVVCKLLKVMSESSSQGAVIGEWSHGKHGTCLAAVACVIKHPPVHQSCMCPMSDLATGQ